MEFLSQRVEASSAPHHSYMNPTQTLKCGVSSSIGTLFDVHMILHTSFFLNYWSQTAVLDCGACGEKYHKSKQVDCLQIARLLIIFFSGNFNSMLLFYLKHLIRWRTKKNPPLTFPKMKHLVTLNASICLKTGIKIMIIK